VPAPAMPQMALAQLADLVRREAFVMAYSDCFTIMGVAMLVSVLAVFMMKKPGSHQAAAE
jgi:DHA2 family multidrug resistance protein